MEHLDKVSTRMHSVVATWAPKQCAFTSLSRATASLYIGEVLSIIWVQDLVDNFQGDGVNST